VFIKIADSYFDLSKIQMMKTLLPFTEIGEQLIKKQLFLEHVINYSNVL